MPKKSKPSKRQLEPQKVKLKAKANWQLPDRFVKAGEIIKVDKAFAKTLLNKTNNFFNF